MGIRQLPLRLFPLGGGGKRTVTARCVVEFDPVAEDFGQIRTVGVRNSVQGVVLGGCS